MAKETKRDTANMPRGLPRYYELLDSTRGLRKHFFAKKDIIRWFMFGIIERYIKTVIRVTERHEPQVATWYGNAPEIPQAMGIVQAGTGEMVLHSSLDNVLLSHKTPTPANTCGLLRVATAVVEYGLTPTPTAMLCMMEPCDGQATLSELVQKIPEWKDVPAFALDAPYGNTEEDYEYFVGELRRMIAFLEETCGKKMTERALRRVCREGNKQYALWKQISENQAAIPAPMSGFFIMVSVPALTQHLFIGDKRTTWFLRLFAKVSSKNVKKGIGAVPRELHRCVWLDIPYSAGTDYAAWLAETYGAVVVTSTWGEGHHYTPIDTTNMDTMLHGIAKRSLSDVSMIRDSRSTVEQFIEDVKYMVSVYHADCVIFPGHKGHKDMPATIGFLRDVCRDLNVPLLELSLDLSDPTYKTPEEVRRASAEFFDAQGWERIGTWKGGAK